MWHLLPTPPSLTVMALNIDPWHYSENRIDGYIRAAEAPWFVNPNKPLIPLSGMVSDGRNLWPIRLAWTRDSKFMHAVTGHEMLEPMSAHSNTRGLERGSKNSCTSKNSGPCENQGRVHLGDFDPLEIAHFHHLARNFRMPDPHSKIYIMGEVWPQLNRKKMYKNLLPSLVLIFAITSVMASPKGGNQCTPDHHS